MTNRTCPIGYAGVCSDCEHWQDNECCRKDALCPVCGAHLESWQQMMGEVHYCPTLSGACKARNLPQAMLDSALGEWYEKGYRLVMGAGIVTLYYAGYDDVVFVFGRKVPGIIPAIKQACYLHALKKRGRANG